MTYYSTCYTINYSGLILIKLIKKNPVFLAALCSYLHCFTFLYVLKS